MNYYNLIVNIYKFYTLYNNVFYNYNFYILSLFFNPFVTYMFKRKKEKTIIYVLDKTRTNIELDDNINEKLKNDDSIEKIDYNLDKDFDNFILIEKIENK